MLLQDVGSNVGYFTLFFAQLVGDYGRVLAVEASPRTYDLVMTTVEFNGGLLALLRHAAAQAEQPLACVCLCTSSTGTQMLAVRTIDAYAVRKCGGLWFGADRLTSVDGSTQDASTVSLITCLHWGHVPSVAVLLCLQVWVAM